MSRCPPADKFLPGLLCAAALALPGTALARSSDRNQPMDIEANSNNCYLDANGMCQFVGNVIILQGTLDIRAAKADIYRVAGEPSRTVLTGGPVVMKQQMDDGTPFTARAANVDYNLKTEVVILTGNVSIEQPRGRLTGGRVVYNLKTGRVDSGGAGEDGGRVRMRINPKSAQGAG